MPTLRIPDLHPDYREVDLVVESCLATKHSSERPSRSAPDGSLGVVIVRRADGARGPSPLVSIRDDRELWETLRHAYLGNLRFRVSADSAA